MPVGKHHANSSEWKTRGYPQHFVETVLKLLH